MTGKAAHLINSGSHPRVFFLSHFFFSLRKHCLSSTCCPLFYLCIYFYLWFFFPPHSITLPPFPLFLFSKWKSMTGLYFSENCASWLQVSANTHSAHCTVEAWLTLWADVCLLCGDRTFRKQSGRCRESCQLQLATVTGVAYTGRTTSLMRSGHSGCVHKSRNWALPKKGVRIVVVRTTCEKLPGSNWKVSADTSRDCCEELEAAKNRPVWLWKAVPNGNRLCFAVKTLHSYRQYRITFYTGHWTLPCSFFCMYCL